MQLRVQVARAEPPVVPVLVEDDEDRPRWRIAARIRGLPSRLRRPRPRFTLGDRVLVIAGEARNDLGQMAVVDPKAGGQYEITYRGPAGGLKSRRKQATSLVRMEDGIEMATYSSGWPVIRRIPGFDDIVEAAEVVEVVAEGSSALSSETDSHLGGRG